MTIFPAVLWAIGAVRVIGVAAVMGFPFVLEVAERGGARATPAVVIEDGAGSVWTQENGPPVRGAAADCAWPVLRVEGMNGQ